MKKLIVYLCLLAVALCLFSGCNDPVDTQGDLHQGEESQQEEKSYKVEDLYKQFMAGEITAVDENNVEKSVDEYVLDGHWDDDYTFAFIDMTNDGTPELCIDNGLEMYFFTLGDVSLRHWYTDTKSYSRLLNNCAFLYERHGGIPDHINYEYYELDEDATVKFSVSFSWWDSPTDSNGDHPGYYSFNGQEVSKEEYEEKTKDYLSIGSDEIVWYDKDGTVVKN